MQPHEYVEPEGSFWRGLCPMCAREREHPLHVREESIELAGTAERPEAASRAALQQRKASA